MQRRLRAPATRRASGAQGAISPNHMKNLFYHLGEVSAPEVTTGVRPGGGARAAQARAWRRNSSTSHHHRAALVAAAAVPRSEPARASLRCAALGAEGRAAHGTLYPHRSLPMYNGAAQHVGVECRTTQQNDVDGAPRLSSTVSPLRKDRRTDTPNARRPRRCRRRGGTCLGLGRAPRATLLRLMER
eukprot:scaffold631_cov378-Prasinococcus_capsulatus_cf.AAC.27